MTATEDYRRTMYLGGKVFWSSPDGVFIHFVSFNRYGDIEVTVYTTKAVRPNGDVVAYRMIGILGNAGRMFPDDVRKILDEQAASVLEGAP